jgi:hypothetical protein
MAWNNEKIKRRKLSNNNLTGDFPNEQKKRKKSRIEGKKQKR